MIPTSVNNSSGTRKLKKKRSKVFPLKRLVTGRNFGGLKPRSVLSLSSTLVLNIPLCLCHPQEELERLNKRRAEREVEQQLREEEEARMARMAESAQMAEWISKDGDFQLEQERRRAGIRLKERRAKAIDFLALNLKFAGPNAGTEVEDDGLGLDEIGLEIDLDEPYAIFDVGLARFPVEETSTYICRRISTWLRPKNCTTTLKNIFDSKQQI